MSTPIFFRFQRQRDFLTLVSVLRSSFSMRYAEKHPAWVDGCFAAAQRPMPHVRMEEAWTRLPRPAWRKTPARGQRNRPPPASFAGERCRPFLSSRSVRPATCFLRNHQFDCARGTGFIVGQDVPRPRVFSEIRYILSGSHCRVETLNNCKCRRGPSTPAGRSGRRPSPGRRFLSGSHCRPEISSSALQFEGGGRPSRPGRWLIPACRLPQFRPNSGWHVAERISNGRSCGDCERGTQRQIEFRRAARRTPALANCSCATGAAAFW